MCFGGEILVVVSWFNFGFDFMVQFWVRFYGEIFVGSIWVRFYGVIFVGVNFVGSNFVGSILGSVLW